MKKINCAVKTILLAVLFAPLSCLAADKKELCVFQDDKGIIKQVNSRSAIPPQFVNQSKCIEVKSGEFMAAPEDVKLGGTIRRENMSSSLGRIQLRWPRKVEVLFGRTPQRAVEDAASTANRALKASSFSSVVQNLNLDWQIVFMDEDLPESQIPRSLISNCHPAWMTPPANLYVVAQRVVAGCEGGPTMQSRVADSELAHILLHEMGHAIEFQLLGETQDNNRMMAEGFASWFEQYSSDYSSIITRGSIRERYMGLAKQSIAMQPRWVFSGTAHDYARASLIYHAIVDKRGVKGLMDIYDTMRIQKLDFLKAMDKKLSWDQKRLEQEIANFILRR